MADQVGTARKDRTIVNQGLNYLSFHMMSSKMVHFEVFPWRPNPDPVKFIIHKDLLDRYAPDFPYFRVAGGPPTQLKSSSDDGEAYRYDYCDPAVFRGFVHWLYTGKLPTADDIRKFPYPREWDEGKENEPLAVNMAFELYIVALELKVLALNNATMSFLFDYYTEWQIVPSMDRIRSVIHDLEDYEDEPLENFLVDICYRVGDKNLADTRMTNWKEYMDMSLNIDTSFLLAIYRRHCMVRLNGEEFAEMNKEDYLVE
ncbi:hypothetical protein EJ04DRAFT_558703 [Polyplosphaeria fusca]|uniref:BTB domain-containing protein n=1 Tax=Polyplosphaeria fusca TaxID=682080 RepID=A0A9P4RBY1_9PLEO|nr:hypothetical protein EJ04DRAFT_558703 [Polyplosphaeria fusca]